MFDVLCLSDCCCDLIFEGLERLPAPGGEEYSRSMHTKAGGGANTPMGLARLGCATAYATALGTDPMGELVRRELLESGVAPDYFQQSHDGRTWVSAVFSTSTDRSFASFAGQPVTCTAPQLKQMVQGVRWVHTYSCYCYSFPFLPQVCQTSGVPFSLDATFGSEKTLEEVQPILEQAALYTPNEAEACGLTGEQEPYRALQKLSRVCQNVVVTMGRSGCMAVLDGCGLRALPPPVKLVDATGAGDLFNAGLIAGRLAGISPEEQLRMATASGTLAVTYPGGMDIAYTRGQVASLAGCVTVERL